MLFSRWTYSFDKIDVGSVMNIGWSSDGTICAGAGVKKIFLKKNIFA